MPFFQKTSSGALFWSGPKRCPNALNYDSENSDHLNFIISSANLRAFNYNIPECRDVAFIKESVAKVDVPAFKPKSGELWNTDQTSTLSLRIHKFYILLTRYICIGDIFTLLSEFRTVWSHDLVNLRNTIPCCRYPRYTLLVQHTQLSLASRLPNTSLSLSRCKDCPDRGWDVKQCWWSR